jgi:hypothetical protein
MLSAMAACFGQRTNRPGRYTEGDLLYWVDFNQFAGSVQLELMAYDRVNKAQEISGTASLCK